MTTLRSSVVHGVLAGLLAGVPQVVLTQIEASFSEQPRTRADIGPRFVQRVAQQLGTSLSTPFRWLLATAFHFGYAAQWGAVYEWLRRREDVDDTAEDRAGDPRTSVVSRLTIAEDELTTTSTRATALQTST